MIKPKALFVCIGNSCRSQMAEGFARALQGSRYEIFSAGSRPAGVVNPLAIEVMKENGIDIATHRSKSTRQVPQERYEVVVTMGCGDACPHLPSKYRLDWQIPDPVGQPIESFRKVRDLVEHEIKDLFLNLEKLERTGHP